MERAETAGSPTRPVVSIVIPCFNGSRFLAETLDSVVAQVWESWEAIVVDDGSTDGSDDIVDLYSRRHPGKFRLIRHPGGVNRGISATRNLGVSEAAGEIVAFLDADDVWESEKLSRQVPLLQSHPEAVLLYGSTLYWFSWTGRNEDIPRDRPGELGFPLGLVSSPIEIIERALVGDAEMPCTCSVLVRKTALNAVGGLEDSFNGWFEDQVLFTKLFLAGPVVLAPGCYERYRQHAKSLTRSPEGAEKFERARQAYVEWAMRYLAQHGYRGARAWRLLRNQWWRGMFPRAFRSAERAWGRLKREKRRLGRWSSRVLTFGTRASARAVAASIPPRGDVRFGDLRRVTPISRHWGWNRGTPIDRFYVQDFLRRNALRVRGIVLEPGDRNYTLLFGGDRVTRSDVLHIDPDAPGATVIADLAAAAHLPSESFDCIILPQTLHLLYELRDAMSTLHRILRPGGTLLVTVPGISQTTDDNWRSSWHWSLTKHSLRRLALECFPASGVEVTMYGNVLSAVSFLHGLCAEELELEELMALDEDYPVTVALVATKPSAQVGAESASS